MDLDIVCGVVNWTTFLRISAAKVSAPSTEAYVNYIPCPFTNHTEVIPNLAAVNYWVRFREAPDTMSLGVLRSEAYVNAVTGQWERERRFYTIGDLPEGVTLDVTKKILNDPDLVGKDVTGVFKEGFRYLKLLSEYEFDDTTGDITSVNDMIFDDGETVIVELQYKVPGEFASPAASLFSDTISVTGATYSIDATDKGKRFSLDCMGTKQAVTLPLISTLANGDTIYLEHKRSGVQAQSTILTAGTDKVLFNGFNAGWPTNLLSELWVSKGQSLLLRKDTVDSTEYWEIILDYKGTDVGNRMAGTFKDHPNWLPEDGRLLDGDEYPALYWWLRNVVPDSEYITDDAVTGSYTHPQDKVGQFVIHSTLKKFRFPNTQNISERGLKNFITYGGDPTNRPVDYPGGYQEQMLLDFEAKLPDDGGGVLNIPTLTNTPNNDEGYGGSSKTGAVNIKSGYAGSVGSEQRVKNFGVIYMRHI